MNGKTIQEQISDLPEGTIYANLGNGIEVYDAKEYYKSEIRCAKNMRDAFIITAVIVFILFLVGWVIPLGVLFVHQTMCSVPNWPVYGGCI